MLLCRNVVLILAGCAMLLAQADRLLDLTVQVVDPQGNPVAGASVRRSGDSIVESQESWIPTDANGFASWKVRNIRTRIGIRARADGYSPDGTQVWTSPLDRKLDPVVIRLTPVPGVMATVMVSDALGSVSGAHVNFAGKGLLGASYSGYSGGDGTARVFVQSAGAYDIEVTEERHEPWRGEVNIRMGMPPPEITARMEAKKDKSTGTERLSSRIFVTVTSGGQPVRGAVVTASGSQAAETDARGRVTIQGTAAIGDQVQVVASAPGYQSGTASALMQVEGVGLGSSRSASGSVTINLVPGEDQLPPDTPIRLLILLTDSLVPGAGVRNVPVSLRFENGGRMADTTAEDGGALFTIQDSPQIPLDMVRRGIRVEIDAQGFKKVLQTVPPQMLKAQLAEVKYDIVLERDRGPALRSLLNELRGEISKFRGAFSLYEASQSQLAGDAKAVADARTTAEAILKAVRNAGSVLDPVVAKCKGDPASGQAGISESSKALARSAEEAEQMLKAFNLNLTQAENLVRRCAAGDGAQARQKHLEATQLMFKLGVLDRKVESISTALHSFALESRNARDVLDQATARLRGFDTLLETSTKAKGEAPATMQAARAAYADGTARESTVLASLSAVQQEYQRASQGGADASLADIGKELDGLARTVRSVRFSALRPALLPGYVGSITADLAAIEEAKRRAESYLSEQQVCTADVKDQERKEVSAAFLEAQSSILVYADLPKQAGECMLRSGPCAEAGRNIRQLLVDGGIEEAQRQIGAAKAKGCDVTDLERDFEGYKLIRDSALLIDTMNAECRFQEAVNGASQLPAVATSSKILRDAMYRSNEGLAAQPKVAAALEAARRAAQAGDAAEAERQLRRAELETKTIPCLLTQVTQAAAGIRTSARNKPGQPQSGPLVGKLTMGSENKRYEIRHGNGRLAGETTQTYTPTTISFERNNYDDKGTRTHRVVIEWTFSGLPASLSPGQTVTVTVSGGFKEVFPAGSADGYVFSGPVWIGGDVDVTIAQQMDRGHAEGKYVFTVRPNARNVEVHFGSAPAGTGGMWKFTNQ